MPVLHRWDSDEESNTAKPSPVWRYDETSEGGCETSSSENESGYLGHAQNYVLFCLLGQDYQTTPSFFWRLSTRNSSSSHSSSDSDNDDDGEMANEPLNVSLTLAGIESFHGLATRSQLASTYSKNGMCKVRVKKAVSSPTCDCQCSVPFGLMLKVCIAFWSLAKSAQDAILWSLQCGGHDRRKRYYHIEGWISLYLENKSWANPYQTPIILKGDWYYKLPWTLGGHSVCREAWLRLLGIGKNRLRRTRKRCRGQDERSLKCGISAWSFTIIQLHCWIIQRYDKSSHNCFASHCAYTSQPAWCIVKLCWGLAKRPAMQTASVKAFLIHLYWTSAESMATKKLGRTWCQMNSLYQMLSNNIIISSQQLHSILRIGAESMLNTSDEELRTKLMNRLVSQSLMGHLVICFSIFFNKCWVYIQTCYVRVSLHTFRS